MSGLRRPRVLLADDHRLVAEGLKSLLMAEFEVVGLVEDGYALIEAARQLQPDVIVADITMPKLNGIEALAPLRKDNPDIKVISESEHPHQAGRIRMSHLGKNGLRSNLASISRIAFLDSETPFW